MSEPPRAAPAATGPATGGATSPSRIARDAGPRPGLTAPPLSTATGDTADPPPLTVAAEPASPQRATPDRAAPPPPPVVAASRSVAHLFVVDLERPAIADEDRHHVERVLRLRPGEGVSVSDANGGVRICAFVAGGGLEPTSAVRRSPPRSPAIAVGFALVKGERPEWVVQKLTECGVDRILPLAAARSVVRWDAEKADRNLDRFRRVAREAAMQSRQVWLPVIEPVRPYPQVAAAEASAAVIADAEGGGLTLGRPVVLVGPEGGWTEAERASLPAVSLGPSVLRAETAALAAGLLLSALRSGVVVEPGARPERSSGASSSP